MKARGIVIGLGLVAVLAAPASARLWKPTPQQLASDYSTITHNKGGTAGRVLIQWVSAPAVTGTLQQVLERYVMLNVSHNFTAPGGLAEWEDIEGVAVTDGAGVALKEVPKDDIPPALVSLIAASEAVARQSSQGKARSKWLVFEAGAVHACAKGGLVVSFEGERYNFDTPVPGCGAAP